MENTAMNIPLWTKIVMGVVCIGLLVLIAMWSVVWAWLWKQFKRSAALPRKMASAVVFTAVNTTKLGHHVNRRLHIRPRHA